MKEEGWRHKLESNNRTVAKFWWKATLLLCIGTHSLLWLTVLATCDRFYHHNVTNNVTEFVSKPSL